MRLCFITTGLGSGGAEMMLHQLISGLVDSFSSSVISLAAGGKYASRIEALGIPVTSLELRPGRVSLSATLKLAKLVRNCRPDVLVGWMYHGCLAATAALPIAGLRVPLIWNIRQSLYDLSLEKRGSAAVIRLLARLSRVPRAVVYNSEVSAAQHELIGFQSRKTHIISNGVDLKRWNLPDVGRDSAEKVVIGRFGRYSAMKDYDTFLRASAEIRRQLGRVEFVLAGSGIDGENEELKRSIAKYALDDCVKVMGDHDDVPSLMRSLDVLVSSSAFGEGFPNVVAEAMAAGVCVVATDVGDSARVINGHGIIVPPRDPVALANACVRLLADRTRMIALRESGRRHIEAMFSLERSVADFRTLINAL